MPLPKVKKGQKEQDFISDCMGDKEANKKFPDQKQRAGVCFSIWKQSKKKKAKADDDTIEGIDIVVI